MPYATTVISRTRDMLESGFLKLPPVWWTTVNAYPPISANARTFVQRDADDLPSLEPVLPNKRAFKATRESLKPIAYEVTDQLRDRFYRDHPWEGARPQTLVEGRGTRPDLGQTGRAGQAWTELRQKVTKPTADDCIDFAANLYRHHNLSLNDAYRLSVDQFRALRARHEIESRFALLEAKAHGATFGPGRIGAGVRAEDAALSLWSKATPAAGEGGVMSRHKSPVALRDDAQNEDDAGVRVHSEFAGQQYTRPITDGTVNPIGHARREPDPQFTGGVAYLATKHKRDEGRVPLPRLAAQTGVLQQHDSSPNKTTFVDFARTSLERRGNPRRAPGEPRPNRKSKGKRKPRGGK